MPTFIAYVEFRFDAATIEMGGRRLRDVATAAGRVGFEMERGRVEQTPAGTETDASRGTAYGPEKG